MTGKMKKSYETRFYKAKMFRWLVDSGLSFEERLCSQVRKDRIACPAEPWRSNQGGQETPWISSIFLDSKWPSTKKAGIWGWYEWFRFLTNVPH